MEQPTVKKQRIAPTRNVASSREIRVWISRLDLPDDVALGVYSFAVYIPQTSNELRQSVQEYCNGKYCLPTIGSWDESKITDFAYLFYSQCDFNEDIGGWDVSNAVNMSFMFNC